MPAAFQFRTALGLCINIIHCQTWPLCLLNLLGVNRVNKKAFKDFDQYLYCLVVHVTLTGIAQTNCMPLAQIQQENLDELQEMLGNAKSIKSLRQKVSAFVRLRRYEQMTLHSAVQGLHTSSLPFLWPKGIPIFPARHNFSIFCSSMPCIFGFACCLTWLQGAALQAYMCFKDNLLHWRLRLLYLL